MEELYMLIAERLNAQMPSLALIDEDTGQLTETEDMYPVIFPCALIDVSTVDWSNDKDFRQRGDAVITIKHAFDCHEDTHLSSARYQQFADLSARCGQHKQLCSALHRYCLCENVSPLQRIQSRHYTLYGRIKVYEVTFRCKIAEDLLPGEQA